MFNGIWLVASEPLTIQGRDIHAGEQFHISRVHSGALLVTGRATIAHPQPGPKAKVLEAEPPAKRRRGRPRKTDVPETLNTPDTTDNPDGVDPGVDPTESPEAIEVPRPRYQRRDLEAEE